jgi:hypothetical protein
VRAVLVAVSLAVLVAGGIASAGVAVQLALPAPTAAELVRVGAAGWFARERLVEATIWTGGARPVRTQCVSGSLRVRGGRRLPAADVLAMGRGGAVIDIQGLVHLIGRVRWRTPRWGLTEMRLAGCPGIDGALLATAVRNGSAHVERTVLAGAPTLSVRFPARLARLTIYVRAGTFKPIAISITTPKSSAHSRISLAPLTRAHERAVLERVSP